MPELYFFKPFLRPLTAFPFCESPQPSQGSCAAAYTCSVNMLSGSKRGGFFTARWMCKRGEMQSISSLSVARLRVVSRAITHGTSSWMCQELCVPHRAQPLIPLGLETALVSPCSSRVLQTPGFWPWQKGNFREATSPLQECLLPKGNVFLCKPQNISHHTPSSLELLSHLQAPDIAAKLHNFIAFANFAGTCKHSWP